MTWASCLSSLGLGFPIGQLQALTQLIFCSLGRVSYEEGNICQDVWCVVTAVQGHPSLKMTVLGRHSNALHEAKTREWKEMVI